MKRKLDEYIQLDCPMGCGRRLRGYLYPHRWDEPHYETSFCPEHKGFWLLPELAATLKIPKRKWKNFETGLV